ncbi:MAG TPA: Pycsar system effector family protein [Longimicrobium sp.]|nr:Pycsar system effector family protein [Longimicrobium sp.]
METSPLLVPPAGEPVRDDDSIEFSEELMKPLLRSASVEEDEFMEQYLWNVNQYLNEHVRFSDTKAGSVIVLSGALLSMLYGGGLHRTFAAVPLGAWRLRGVAALVTFLLLGGSVLAAAWSMRPRLVRGFARGYVFWESILAHGSPMAFVRDLNLRSRQELLDHLAIQLYAVSGICSTKFRWVGRAVVLCLTGAMLAAVVLITG